MVSSGINTPLLRGISDPDRPIYACVKGNLEGFNPYTGVFSAPKTGFYKITIFCNYISATPVRMYGVTHTKAISFSKIVPARKVLPFGSTNAFTVIKGNSVSYTTISGHVPLEKDEKFILSLYQENDIDEPTFVSLELTIVQGAPYNRCLEYVHFPISPRHQCTPELIIPSFVTETIEEEIADLLDESRNRAAERRILHRSETSTEEHERRHRRRPSIEKHERRHRRRPSI